MAQRAAKSRPERAVRRLLTVAEASELSNLNEKYLRRLIADGRLECVKMGGSDRARVMIPESALAALTHEGAA